VLYLFYDATHMPPRVIAAATRPGHSHRRPLPLPLACRSPGGGLGSCPMAPTPGDLPTSSPSAQAPSHALRLGNTPSRFLPRFHNALPRSFEVRWLLRVVPGPSSVVRPSKFPRDNVHYRARQLPKSGCRSPPCRIVHFLRTILSERWPY
jgi:hypothetical protein